MEDKKKKVNWLRMIITILFIAYMALYILNETGYYDGSIRRKVEFTKEQIAEFEQDVENGEQVDINKYLANQNKDYTNKTSKLGYEISSNLEAFINRGLKEFGKLLGKLFT